MEPPQWPLQGGNYPESFIPSNRDCPLKDSGQYLPTLQKILAQLPQDFDICLVVQGADPFELDELASSGELNLNLQQMLHRDQFIHHWLFSHSIPQAYCMGGGYGKETWRVYFQYLYWALNQYQDCPNLEYMNPPSLHFP